MECVFNHMLQLLNALYIAFISSRTMENNNASYL